MARIASESISRQLESLFEGGSVAGLADRHLLERFNAARGPAGEAAFAALVARHGPMVLNVCRQLLGDHHHAEDSFQAVFLVLARRSRSIRDPDLLGNWLYGVALRTARCAKAQLDRRHNKEEGDAMNLPRSGSLALAEPIAEPADQPILDREQAEAVHRAVEHLPKSFRLPIVLCYFEGLTLDEAARRMRCPTGTLRSRLARARDKLRRALTLRGVVLPTAALACVLESRAVNASVSSTLCNITTRAAIEFADGRIVSSAATALAGEVLRLVFVSRLKFIALAVFLIVGGYTGVGFLARALTDNNEKTTAPAGQQPLIVAKPDDAKQKPAPGRMFVVGRVLDPAGKPVPGAMVVASARTKVSERAVGLERITMTVIGHVNADGSGRFRLDAPRTSSSRNDECMAIALAPGYGVGWVKIDPDADEPAAEVYLQPEQVIEGRFFDLQGRPAQGVLVSVSTIQRDLIPDSTARIAGSARSEGPIYRWNRINDMPAWPKPATTDADGRFAIRGAGHRSRVALDIIDPRFALQTIAIATDDAPGPKVVTTALQPAKTFTGRVTYADTGKPVARARLEVLASGEGQPGSRSTYFQTDVDGRFRVNPSPGDLFLVGASPPAGQLYLVARKRVDWPKGAVEQSLDLALPRGVTIRGMVVEEGSDRPVVGALVDFRSQLRAGEFSSDGLSESVTAADGSFELAVPPGAGHLAVQAKSDDYVLREIGNREFFNGRPGGRRLYSHSFVACDPQPGGPGLDVHVALRRGVTVAGRITDADDQPVRDAWIIDRSTLRPTATAWRMWHGEYHGEAPSGRFELHGLGLDSDRPVYFLQPKRRLGATAHLSGKSAAGGPITIRLESCGTATARLVDAHGKPLAGYRGEFLMSMIITPGPSPAGRDPADAKLLAAERDFVVWIDPINYANPPFSDAHGRISFPALIPGASYQIVRSPTSLQPRKVFTIKPGETLDLGDILIEKPQVQ